MLEECFFHRCNIKIKRKGEIIGEIDGLMTRFSEKKKEDGLSTCTVEGGVYTSKKEDKIDYLIGYNGLRSDGLLRCIVLTNGEDSVYDLVLQRFPDDNCYYGAYYKIGKKGDKKTSKFMGYLKLTESYRCNDDETKKYAREVFQFDFDDPNIHRETLSQISGEHLSNLCEHDDFEARIRKARKAFTGKNEDNLKLKKVSSGQK